MGKLYGGRWEVQKPLVEGGQSFTYLVRDTKGAAETSYVLKRLKNLDRIERFKQEIEATRNLSHENIVRLHDFELEGKNLYLVTEYCEFGRLSRSEPFWRSNLRRAFDIFEQICNGVNYAHKHNIVHRDLKPDNIFLRGKEGPAVVGDFGLCFIDIDGSRVTLTEEAVGSRYYMAPELENGKSAEVSNKSDIYSLGKILYWLLSGKIFSREVFREPQWDLKSQIPDSPTRWNNIYMEHVNRLLDQMIRVNPGERLELDSISAHLPRLIRLVEKEYTPIAGDIKQPCAYCGYGYYRVRASNMQQAFEFGLRLEATEEWRILTCDVCGHVQIFRVDSARWK